MNKRLKKALALGLSLAMIFGMVRTPVTAYAVSDEASLEVSAETEALTETVETADDAAAASGDSFDLGEDPVIVTKESYVFTLKNAKIEAGLKGEDLDKKLDELFGPELEVEDVVFTSGGKDEYGFTTSYKFVTIPKSEDITEDDKEYLDALTLPASDKDFALIEDEELSEIPAGSRVLVYARALTAQGKDYFTANIAYITEPETAEAQGEEDADDADAATEEDSEDDAAALTSDAEEAAEESSESATIEEEAPVEETDTEDVLVGDDPSEESSKDAPTEEPTPVDDYKISYSYDSNYDYSSETFIYKSRVSFHSLYDDQGCTVELYASKSADKKDAWKIGERKLLGFSDVEYVDEASREATFIARNSIYVSREDFSAAGDYTLFAKYHLKDEDGNDRISESPNTLTLHVTAAPEVAVTDATNSYSTGTVSVTDETKKYEKALLYSYYSQKTRELTKSESVYSGYANPGHYRVAFEPVTPYPSDTEFWAGSMWADVTVSVQKKALEAIRVVGPADMGYTPSNPEYAKQPVTIAVKGTAQLAVQFYPSDYEDRRVSFDSEDETIAKVDPSGVVTGISEGETTITATVSLAVVAPDSSGSTQDDDPPAPPAPEMFKSSTIKVIVVKPNKAYTAKTFKFEETTVNLTDKTGKVTAKVIGDAKLNEIGASIKFTQTNPDAAYIGSTGGIPDGEFDENGEALLSMYRDSPGQTVVTARLAGTAENPVKEKTAILTVNVDGYNYNNEMAYKDGKNITGWVNTDSETFLLPEKDKNLPKEDIDLTTEGSMTFYVAPSTKKAVKGVYKVGGKLYLFGNDLGILFKKQVTVNGSLITFSTAEEGLAKEENVAGTFCLNIDGSLNTGWQTLTVGEEPDVQEKSIYFDPATGQLVKSSWVPEGKSYVHVDSNGYKEEITDGFNNIGKKTYCYKDGVLQTGFVYAKGSAEEGEEGEVLFVKPKEADHAYYLDPQDGGSLVTGLFTVGKKTYYADSVFGKILFRQVVVANPFTPVLYYLDNSGVVAMNKFVTWDGKQYYAGPDGKLLVGVQVIKGKTYYFDETDGHLISYNEGAESGLYYKAADGTYAPVVVKNIKKDKPAEGSLYYADADCKTKLTNCWLFENVAEKPEDDAVYAEAAYLDKNGKRVTGIQKIGDYTYHFDADGTLNSTPGVTEVIGKNRYYKELVTDETSEAYGKVIVVTDPRFVNAGPGTFVYVKDTKGVLATGLTTIDKKKYLFDGSCALVYPRYTSHFISLKESDTKRYYCHRTGTPASIEEAKDCYIETGKKPQVIKDSTGLNFVNKDGTGYTGFYTYDGKKYFCTSGEPFDHYDYLVVGGKAYCLSYEGYALSGWAECEEGMDLNNYDGIPMDEKQYFYCDPRTLNPVTGWKEVSVPAVDGEGNILKDANGAIKVTNVKKKLYFSETGSFMGLTKGALVRNTTMTIKGKVYQFGADGTLKTDSEGKAFLDNGTNETSPEAYRNADGTLASGRTKLKINGTDHYYYYSPRTHKLEKNVLRKTGSKWYYYGSSGEQSTDFYGYLASEGYARAVYNKDGSIKYISHKGTLVKVINDVMSGPDYRGTYVIGNNGLPKTGLCDIPKQFAGYYGGIKLVVDNDGASADTWKSNGKYYFTRIGKKIYIVKNGLVQDGFTSPVKVEDLSLDMFSELSGEELKALVIAIEFNGELSGGEGCSFYTQADGSLAARTVTCADGSVIHTNRFGLAKEYSSIVYKMGSNWYLNPKIKAMMEESGLVGDFYFDAPMYDMMEGYSTVAVRFTHDRNYKITSITYGGGTEAGKPANGIYMFEGGAFFFSKGKIVTGKKSITFEGIKVTMNFDSENGMAIILLGS